MTMAQTIPLINHSGRVNIRLSISGRRTILLTEWLSVWNGSKKTDLLQYWANELSALNQADEQLETWFTLFRLAPSL